MPPSTTGATRLVADIGGTHTRLAVFDPGSNDLRARRTYRNRDYGQLADLVADWLRDLAGPHPVDACLAVAAPPPFDDRVRMVNMDWSFSLRELADRFGFARLHCINDFQANAYALPHLDAGDLVTLHRGDPGAAGKLATVGPGTGLGGATLEMSGPAPVACASEPGHMGLAPATELELALFAHLLPRYGEVYAELLLSGPGLSRLYRALAAVRGGPAEDLAPEEISTRALAGQCGLCTEALHTFCALLGSVCGDFVLANGAYGGLYLAGGIVPHILEFLRTSTFIPRFRAKGEMSGHLARVPLHVITGTSTGLLGAAHAPF